MTLNKTIRDIAIVSFITILAWAGFEIYREYQKPSAPLINQELTKPLELVVKEDIKNNLLERISY